MSLDLSVKIFVRSDEHRVVVSGKRNISRIIESDMQLSRDLAGRAGRDWSRIGASGNTAEDSCEC